MARAILAVLGIAALACIVACGGSATPTSLPPLDPSQAPTPPVLTRPPAGDVPPVIPGFARWAWLDDLGPQFTEVFGTDPRRERHPQCKRSVSPEGERFVRATGPTVQTADEIRATAIATGRDADGFARDFFARVAALPYDGAEPETAGRWAAENVGGNASVVIGSVRFEMLADGPAVRILRITPASTEPAPLAAVEPGSAAPETPAAATGLPRSQAAGHTEDDARAAAVALSALLAESGPLDGTTALAEFIPRLNEFAADHEGTAAGIAAEREAAALARLRLAYAASAASGTDPGPRLREVAETYPDTVAARAARARLSRTGDD